MSQKDFKRCGCDRNWADVEEFLSDPEVRLVGYQPNFQHLELGIILFNHLHCRSTLGVPVSSFEVFDSNPKFRARGHEDPDCSGLCYQRSNLEQCPRECECQWVRDLLVKLRARMGQGS